MKHLNKQMRILDTSCYLTCGSLWFLFIYAHILNRNLKSLKIMIILKIKIIKSFLNIYLNPKIKKKSQKKKKMNRNQLTKLKYKNHRKRIKKKSNSRKTMNKSNNLKKMMKKKVFIIKKTFMTKKISMSFMKAQDSLFHSWSIDM